MQLLKYKNMKTRLFFSLIMLCITLNVSSQASHIQVVSDPGLTVFLDGVFKGVTASEYGGLIIQNISPGQHQIKVVKEGSVPIEETISVKAGEVFLYQVNNKFTKISDTAGDGEDKELIKNRFYAEYFSGEALKKNKAEGVFSGNDRQIHKFKIQYDNISVIGLKTRIILWIDDKQVLDEKGSDGDDFFVSALPKDPFIMRVIYNGNEPAVCLIKMQPFLSKDIKPVPYTQEILVDRIFEDLSNTSKLDNFYEWTYFTDSQDQTHNLNILCRNKLVGGYQFDIYLDNKFITQLQAKKVSEIDNLRYTFTSLSPKLEIKFSREYLNVRLLVTLKN